MKVTRRRLFLLGTTGVVGATGGCLAHITGVQAGMMIFTSYPEEVTLEISIAPEYGAESTYQETITVDQDRMPLERESVVSGVTETSFTSRCGTSRSRRRSANTGR